MHSLFHFQIFTFVIKWFSCWRAKLRGTQAQGPHCSIARQNEQWGSEMQSVFSNLHRISPPQIPWCSLADQTSADDSAATDFTWPRRTGRLLVCEAANATEHFSPAATVWTLLTFSPGASLLCVPLGHQQATCSNIQFKSTENLRKLQESESLSKIKTFLFATWL